MVGASEEQDPKPCVVTHVLCENAPGQKKPKLCSSYKRLALIKPDIHACSHAYTRLHDML